MFLPGFWPLLAYFGGSGNTFLAFGPILESLGLDLGHFGP